MLKTKTILVLLIILSSGEFILNAQENNFDLPILDDQVVFEEKVGLVCVEAEFFYKQSLTETRKWYRTSKNERPKVGRDDDDQAIWIRMSREMLQYLATRVAGPRGR